MPCYHPIPAYRILGGRHEKYSVIAPDDDGGGPPLTYQEQLDHELQGIPCGKCVGCLLKRAGDWSTRCVHELRYHKASAFLTLTYDSKHLPPDRGLRPRDLTLFVKQLRHHAPPGIKYLACGEYGDRRGRPHYHMLLFGHDFLDKEPIPNNEGTQFPLYHSAELDAIWKHGYCTLGTATDKSADYVARYTLKKQYGLKKRDNPRLQEPFLRVSKGVGQKYFDEFHKDMYPSDFLVDENTYRKKTIPRYYDKKLDELDPGILKAMKAKRREALKPGNPDFTDERLRVRETTRLLKIKALTRSYDDGPT